MKTLEESIETRVSPQRIWEAWQKAHSLAPGIRGETGSSKGKGFKYTVLDVVEGERFSICWKTLFVRLIFSHSVLPKNKGSEIRYSLAIRGLFAPMIRWLLGKKIRSNLRLVLKTMVYRLEEEQSCAKYTKTT